MLRSNFIRFSSSSNILKAPTTRFFSSSVLVILSKQTTSIRFCSTAATTPSTTKRASFAATTTVKSEVQVEEKKPEVLIQKEEPTKSATTTSTNSEVNQQQQQPQMNEPLWPNCDTVEDILEEEKYGAEGEEDKQPPIEPEHIVLAFRAFVWGTFWAVFGVGLISLIAMKMAGFSNIKDVLGYVGAKDKRNIEEMKKQGVEVIEYSIDLTNPTTVPDQLSQVWTHILESSGIAAELEKAVEEDRLEQEKKEREEAEAEAKKN